MPLLTVWSTLIGRELHSVASPALLWLKEPARATAFLAPRWLFED